MGTAFTIFINNKYLKEIIASEIIFLKADGNYTFFYLNNGKKVIGTKSLKEYHNLLCKLPFVRTHKSFLLNMSYYDSIDAMNESKIHLQNGQIINISRRQKKAFEESIRAFNEQQICN